jgi:hypothetical protein
MKMEGFMHAERSTHSQRERAVEVLAQESRAPIDDVAQLYGKELAKLEVDARIKSFIPIFALRNVRDLLRQRGTMDQASVQAGSVGSVQMSAARR